MYLDFRSRCFQLAMGSEEMYGRGHALVNRQRLVANQTISMLLLCRVTRGITACRREGPGLQPAAYASSSERIAFMLTELRNQVTDHGAALMQCFQQAAESIFAIEPLFRHLPSTLAKLIYL